MFKEGKLEGLPPDLVEHLQKFTNRELNFKPFEIPEEFKQNNTKSLVVPNIKLGTEYSEIISSYKRIKNKADNDESKENVNTKRSSKVQKVPETDTYVLNDNTRLNRRHATLSSFREKIEKRNREGKAFAEEKIILDALKEDHLTANTEPSLQPTIEVDQALNRYPTSKNNMGITKFDENQKQVMDYPERIIIPKNKYKPGYTYKLNDCYYDDDGEFLYRVPGMYK